MPITCPPTFLPGQWLRGSVAPSRHGWPVGYDGPPSGHTDEVIAWGSTTPWVWHCYPGERMRNIASGDWSNPAIWSLGRVPARGDWVTIQYNTTVNFNVVMSDDVTVLRFLLFEDPPVDSNGFPLAPAVTWNWIGPCRLLVSWWNQGRWLTQLGGGWFYHPAGGPLRSCFAYDFVTLARRPGIPAQVGPPV